jgi:hypothetical protein
MKKVLLICLVIVLLVGCSQSTSLLEPIDHETLDALRNNEAVRNGQASNGQASNGQAGDEQVGNEQVANEQVANEQVGNEQVGNEQAVNEPNHTMEISPSKKPKQFRLEVPTTLERKTLPSCDKLQFTTFPVNMGDVSSITPLGNIGPPGHTFPTQHPHLHMGEHKSGRSFDIVAPADVKLTMISWGDAMSSDPRDYVIYFALCEDVIGYYNHIKTISPELQAIVDKYDCEGFSSGSGCTKVLNLDPIKAGTLLGTVGLKQGNWDFGLIDLSKPLNFINPLRQPERDRFLHCAFDYYPEEMKKQFYSKINRDDGTCGQVMQDLPGTLQGDWYHESAGEEYVTEWDVYLAFVHDWQFSNAQVVSIAGKFTNPSKIQFNPKGSGTINRDFSGVTADGKVYCFQGEDIGRSFDQVPSGKIAVRMVDETTLEIEHHSGQCSGNEKISNPEIYER